MKLGIRHDTHYEYSAPLQYAMQQLCLTPQDSAHQTVIDWSLSAPGPLYAQRDGHGNLAHSWSLTQRKFARHVYRGSVCAAGTVLTHASPWLADAPSDPPPALYLRATPLTVWNNDFADLARTLGRDGGAAALLELAAAVRAQVRYRAGLTSVGTTAQQALALGAGVCQDQTHVFIAACRAAGLPARYVSGYFHSPSAPDLASHAWADVCLDRNERRWLSVDITHASLMDERHVRLAVGPDYAACAPVRGMREGGGEESMRVHLTLRRVDEEVTLES